MSKHVLQTKSCGFFIKNYCHSAVFTSFWKKHIWGTRICFTIWRKKKKKTSNMLVTISLTNQLQVLSIEVLCLTSQLEDMLCNSTFSNKYICPWELSPIATAKIGASWKIPVCPSTLAHPARKDYGSVN